MNEVVPSTMRAMRLAAPAEVSIKPLRLEIVPVPTPGPGEVLIAVHTCGVCHTDLHTVEGELEPHRAPVVPGHQIVGEVVAFGDQPGERHRPLVAADGRPLELGERVGVPWLWKTDGSCPYCRRGDENLCEHAMFTGYDVDGGYAEYTVAPAEFVYRLPEEMDDLAVAPLLCAGVIGYRSLRLIGVVDSAGLPAWRRPQPGDRPATMGDALFRQEGGSRRQRLRQVSGALREAGDPRFAEMRPFDEADAAPAGPGVSAGRLGLYGFGAAAHICVQIAVHHGWEVYVFTRGSQHRDLAVQLGAMWAGASGEAPGGDSSKKLDAAVIFAPAGELALDALRATDKGGIVALGGIHSSPIPPIEYQTIHGERVLRSVANSMRRDALDLLAEAPQVPVHTEVEVFPLEQANEALIALKQGHIRGAAVLQIR
jgi:alcohol dehydrogenase, propanol-preferring